MRHSHHWDSVLQPDGPVTCSLTVGSGGRRSDEHMSCGKGPGLEDGGCPRVCMGECVLTQVPFLLGEGLEVNNLVPPHPPWDCKQAAKHL